MSVAQDKTDKSDAATVELRIIKKYPNRRLYDTFTSSYIKLAQVKELIMQRKQFVVYDSKSKVDVTRSVLMQIILEEELGGRFIFSDVVLLNIIRFYGHAMQGFVGGHLEKNMQMFTDMQAEVNKQIGGLTPELWLQKMVTNYIEQSQNVLSHMQNQMFTAFKNKP